MLRRIVHVFVSQRTTYTSHRFVAVSEEARERLTKNLSAVKEECKGQALDLADMSDAAKATSHSLQECLLVSKVQDEMFKSKVESLSSLVKVYNNRLNNLKNEAWSIEMEVDVLLKMLWGNANAKGASFAMPPPTDTDPLQKESLINTEQQNVTKNEAVSTNLSFNKSDERVEVECIVGEKVVDKVHRKEQEVSDDKRAEEIEVETIEIDLEPETTTDMSVDEMKITDITKELYERGVDFSDCLDPKSLRQRYRDILNGKVYGQELSSSSVSTTTRPYSQPLFTNTDQPAPPPRSFYNEQQSYAPPPPNPNEAGLAHDPYPNAMRKMVDAMKYVWQIKQELAAEKGIDPNNVDLWSGKVKLEDHKRLYDYPTVQNHPIEVRQKGDMPL